MSRWRRLAVPTVKVLCIVLVMLLVGEALQRLKSFGATGLTYHEMRGMTNLQQSAFAVDPPEESMKLLAGWGMLPGTAGVRKGASFQVNNLGFRGPDAVLKKEAGTFRIVVVGGSMSLGSGVELQETWPAVLEGLMEESLANAPAASQIARRVRRFEVFNLAMPQTVHGFPRALQRALYFRPDLVLWQVSAQGSQEKQSKNLLHANTLAGERSLPILSFMISDDQVPGGVSSSLAKSGNRYFTHLGALGVEYGQSQFLFPEDPHPKPATHVRIAEAVWEQLTPRLKPMLVAVTRKRPDCRTSWEPPEPIPSRNRRDGFWRSYLVKRLYCLLADRQWSPLGESF